MEYELTRLVNDNEHSVALTAEEFTAVRTARRNLIEALGLEEKYNLLLGNFEEFEREMLALTLRHALYLELEWSTVVGDIHLLNRRLINALSTARLYLDHLRHTMSAIYGRGSEQFAAISKRTNEEYDSRRGYRVIEELRNHVQHRGLPIALITFKGKRANDESPTREEGLMIRLDPLRLEEDGEFKRRILDELNADSAACELKPLVRDYVTGIGNVHGKARELLATDISAGEALVRKMISRYRDQAGPGVSLVGLTAIAIETGRDNSGQPNRLVEHIPLFEEFMQRRKWLEKRNSTGHGKLNFIVTSA